MVEGKGGLFPYGMSDKSKNPLFNLLYSMGFPDLVSGRTIHQDEFMRRLNAGQINMGALTQKQGSAAGAVADPAATGGMGGPMQRPRGGMMGFSPFRISTRYNQGR